MLPFRHGRAKTQKDEDHEVELKLVQQPALEPATEPVAERSSSSKCDSPSPLAAFGFFAFRSDYLLDVEKHQQIAKHLLEHLKPIRDFKKLAYQRFSYKSDHGDYQAFFFPLAEEQRRR